MLASTNKTIMASKQLEIIFPKFLFKDGTPYYDCGECHFCKDTTKPCYGFWYCSKSRKKKKNDAAKDGCDNNT